jgi:hypothetical protein
MNAVLVSSDEINDRNSMIISVPSIDDGFLVAGILGSRIVSDWFVQKYDKFQRKTFPQIKSGELACFPFPKAIPPDISKEMISVSKKLHENSSSKVDSRVLTQVNEKLDEVVENAFKASAKAEKKKAS